MLKLATTLIYIVAALKYFGHRIRFAGSGGTAKEAVHIKLKAPHHLIIIKSASVAIYPPQQQEVQ